MYKSNIGLIFLILLFISICNLSAQTPGRAYYRIERIPGELTKSVNVWGYVTLPGRYEVPVETNLLQLITFAGGPRDYALMDEIKIYRLN